MCSNNKTNISVCQHKTVDSHTIKPARFPLESACSQSLSTFPFEDEVAKNVLNTTSFEQKKEASVFPKSTFIYTSKSSGNEILDKVSTASEEQLNKESKWVKRKELNKIIGDNFNEVVLQKKYVIDVVRDEVKKKYKKKYEQKKYEVTGVNSLDSKKTRLIADKLFYEDYYKEDIEKEVEEYVVRFEKWHEKIRKCGESAHVKVCGNGHRHSLILEESCGSRFCEICAHRSSVKWLHNQGLSVIQYALDNPDYVPVHVVLTLKTNNDSSLSDEIVRLQESFLKLRRRKWYKERFVAGISSIECTFPDFGPHPHLHLLLFRKKWAPQDELKEEWYEVTGDSDIVWINKAYHKGEPYARFKYTKDSSIGFFELQNIQDLVSSIRECSKYVMKLSDIKKLDSRHFTRLVVACHKRNLKDVLGGLRGYSKRITEGDRQRLLNILNPDDIEKDSEVCPVCGDKNFTRLKLKLIDGSIYSIYDERREKT